jgi:ArsR family transcriptional regulator, arsenate/arsenite/antimonite-responsive transcriptional repressor
MAEAARTTIEVIDVSACCATGLSSPLERPEAESLAKILKAVAEPARLQLLALIRATGERCACDLTEPVGLSQPTVSHHLKVLTDAGLITREQRGQWAWFRPNEERLRDLATLFS